MSQLQSKILTDTWVKATWDNYLDAAQTLETTKGYYYNGHYRLEIAPIGFDHGCDHTIIMLAIHLYSLARKIDFQGINTCSYRKIGYREVQPDASYYIGATANIIPSGTSIVDLDRYPAPDLVIEVSKSTIDDDLGNKRLLYEELGVSEYWVVDVQNAQVIAFKMIDQGSQRIHTSQILPRLEINLLNEALQRSRQSNHSQVGQWLLQVFQFKD